MLLILLLQSQLRNGLKVHSHYCINHVSLRQMVAFLQGHIQFPISALTQSTAENADHCIQSESAFIRCFLKIANSFESLKKPNQGKIQRGDQLSRLGDLCMSFPIFREFVPLLPFQNKSKINVQLQFYCIIIHKNWLVFFSKGL